MEIKELEQILGLLKQADVSDFELNQEGVHIKLSRGPRHVTSVVSSAAPVAHVEHQVVATAPAQHAAAVSSAPAAIAAHLKQVESPIVGTFYRRPSPDADSFVKEGDKVRKGDTLCIIEAMKLMNEIDAPCDGKIEKILITDGKVVEFGEILFIIDPTQ